MSIFNKFFKKEKPIFTGITRGLGGFGFGGEGSGPPPTVAGFYFGDSRDGDLTASGGTVTLSSQPSPVAPGGVCSSFRVSELTSTRITISAPHGNNVFTAGDKVLLYQRNTSVPESNKVGTYSIHDVASVPSATTIDISDSYASVVPGSESISTPSFKEDTSGPSPSAAANRVYVVRIAQFGTATVNGGTVTTAQDSSHAGIVAIAAQTSITVSSGAITAAGLGYYAGDGAPSGAPIPSPNSGGKGQSYNTEPWTGANNPALPGTNTSAYEIGGGGGSHAPGVFSAGGGGGGSIMVGAAGGGDGPGGGIGVGGGAYPTPRRDTTGASRLSTGGGGGGGADTNGFEGGRGGGIVLLFAPSITISGGSVSARGLASPTDSASAVDTGGGGGGGSVLIRGETVALGTDLVTSKGGDQGGTHVPAGHGGAGGGGMVAVYAPSITGSVTNTTAGSTSQNPSYYSSSWTV